MFQILNIPYGGMNDRTLIGVFSVATGDDMRELGDAIVDGGATTTFYFLMVVFSLTIEFGASSSGRGGRTACEVRTGAFT